VFLFHSALPAFETGRAIWVMQGTAKEHLPVSHGTGLRSVLGLVCVGLGGMMASQALAVSVMTVVDEREIIVR